MDVFQGFFHRARIFPGPKGGPEAGQILWWPVCKDSAWRVGEWQVIYNICVYPPRDRCFLAREDVV